MDAGGYTGTTASGLVPTQTLLAAFDFIDSEVKGTVPTVLLTLRPVIILTGSKGDAVTALYEGCQLVHQQP